MAFQSLEKLTERLSQSFSYVSKRVKIIAYGLALSAGIAYPGNLESAEGERWETLVRGLDNYQAHAICETKNREIVIAGTGYATDGQNNIIDKGVVVKLDEKGKEKWRKFFPTRSRIYCMASFVDGTSMQGNKELKEEYIFAGEGFDREIGDYNLVVFRTDSDGKILSENHYGTKGDYANAVIVTSDRSIALTGSTLARVESESNKGTYLPNILIMKIGIDGKEQWRESYGDAVSPGAMIDDAEQGMDIKETKKGFVIGVKDEKDPYISLLETDKNGQNGFKYNFGQLEFVVNSVSLAKNGDYLATGYSRKDEISNAFLWRIDKQEPTFPPQDLSFIITFRGNANETGKFAVETDDGNYIVAGDSENPENSFGGKDIFLEKIKVKNRAGHEIVWSKNFGGEKTDNLWSAVKTSDGGVALLGITDSFPAFPMPDFPFPYVGKFDSDGNVRHFRRGDVNSDNKFNIGDPILILRYLFGRESIPCEDAADVNDDNRIQAADAISLLSFLFKNGSPPPEPFKVPNFDPTNDNLGCGE